MSHTEHQTALKHARKDKVLPKDVPHLFRWLQEGTENTPARTWEDLKQSIHTVLKTGHNRMRQDTKRLAKIESVTKQLVEALELGASLDIAAAYSGIRPVEFREWLALGHARPRSIYGAFLSLIQAAIAKCDVQDLRVVTKAAEAGEWKAAIERLKMRGFGNQTAPDKKPVNVKIVNYNFAAPAQKEIAQTIDYDTLEIVKEEPVRAITAGEESEELSEQCEDTHARGKTSEAGSSNFVFGATEGETPPETVEKEG
jgi:hypothetical protein